MWIRLRMVGVAVSLLLPSLASAAPAPAAHRLTPAEAKLLFYCAGYYVGDNLLGEQPISSDYVAGDYQEYLREFQQRRALAREAKGVLDRKPAAILRRKLVPLFSQCRPGSPTYLGVAYVLAARGVDLKVNVDRILLSNRLSVTSTNRPISYTEIDRRVSRRPLSMKPLEEMGAVLGQLYRKSHAPFILQKMLRMECDAAECEVLKDTLAETFLASPVEMIRAASGDEKAFRRLRDALAYSEEGNDRRKQVLLTLQRLRNGKDGHLREVAMKLSTAVKRESEAE